MHSWQLENDALDQFVLHTSGWLQVQHMHLALNAILAENGGCSPHLRYEDEIQFVLIAMSCKCSPPGAKKRTLRTDLLKI